MDTATYVQDDAVISSLANDLARSTVKEAYQLIDSVEAVSTFIEKLIDLPTSPPSLYIDLEGVNLSRQGSISIIQIHVAPRNETYLIDIHTLGAKAFDTRGGLDQTLRSILQSTMIPKVFFDVRNDSDALFSHFQISLAGVVDLQVLEYATRLFKKQFVNGLSKCIERDLALPVSQRLECRLIKEKGVELFAPEKGGTYEVFNKRPLLADIALYCVQDVQWLPMLYETYSGKLDRLSNNMFTKVARATLDRVKESQSPLYIGHGKHKAMGPW